jgi:hypothetical protein
MPGSVLESRGGSILASAEVGSRINQAAICPTRSRTVGIPQGLYLPLSFSMYPRLTGCGLQVLARNHS